MKRKDSNIEKFPSYSTQEMHYFVFDEEVQNRIREAEKDPEVLITFDQLIAGLCFRPGQISQGLFRL